MNYPIVKLGVLQGNKLTCPSGEVIEVFPFAQILEEFDGKFAYYQITEQHNINNAVLY